MGGGFYEPVLASLPERDRIGQLQRMRRELTELFGRAPTGAWLAERVWEPDLPTSLAASGYAWTILDDAHFRAAAIPEEALWGPYTTEDQGHLLRVFGTEQGLRYRIPFREVEDVVGYLRDHATEDGSRVGTMGDDGEKFGAWPTTWERCWGEGRWVERFFEAIEANADWLTTVTPSAWLADHQPVGRVYVPTGSYAEMGEWALPADESLVFADVLRRAKADGRPEARWLRGAFWRNFQVKYREVNDLHKQMLRTSDKVEAMAPGAARDLAVDHLYQGQSNDCYWHGLFGGVYISHMRLATHEHLIAAEDLADTAHGRLDASERVDLDMDGVDEVRLATPGQVVTVDLHEGAGIGAWDIRAVRHAVTAVLRRRPEAYHAVLRQHDADVAEQTATGDVAAASIHEAVRVKEAGLAARLVYDTHERRSGLVRFLPMDATPKDWADAAVTELGDALTGAFDIVDARTRLARRRPRHDGLDRRRPGAGPADEATCDSGATAGSRRSSSASTSRTPGPGGSMPGSASSGRRRCSAVAATRQPGGRSAASGAGTTRAARPPRSSGSRRGTTSSGSRSRPRSPARPTPGGRRSRRSRTRSRASNASTRAAGCCCPGRSSWPPGRAGRSS